MSAPYGYGPSPPPSAPPFPWQEQQQGEDQHPAMAYPYHRLSSSSSSPLSSSSSSSSASSSAVPYSSQPYLAPPWGSYIPPSTPPPAPYAPASSFFPPGGGADPEIVRAFQCADSDASGFINENELQRALSSWHSLSLRTSRLLLHMFCSKDSAMLGFKEFATLWKALKDWKDIFERFDRDRSGSIDKSEMREALLSLGYSLSPPILDCLLQKYDRTGQAKAMDYDSFIQSGLIVKGLTEKFKEQDLQLKGSAMLSYQTFMLMVLPFILA